MAVPNYMIGTNDPLRDIKIRDHNMRYQEAMARDDTFSSPTLNFNMGNSNFLDYLNPISSALNSVWNIGSGIFNYSLQKQNLEYQKALQQQIFEREDNAVQRRVDDLRKAGINPMLASGSSASAGSAVSTTAPQLPQSPFQQLSFFDGSKYALGLLKTGQEMSLAQERLDIAKSMFGIKQSEMDLKNKYYGLNVSKFNYQQMNDFRKLMAGEFNSVLKLVLQSLL